jgi:hypothetical protein
MRRHSWKDTGKMPNPVPSVAAHMATVQTCSHCKAERLPDRDFRTQFIYRGEHGRGPHSSPDAWIGRAIAPRCVERKL